MSQTIVPCQQKLEDCLRGTTYHIDFYQREYVWNRATVTQLLDDIFYSFELSYAQYKDKEFSQEVLEQYNWYYLNNIITNNVDGKIYIVDGQQRLTTLALIATNLLALTNNENLKDALQNCIYGKDKWNGKIYYIDNGKRRTIMDCIVNQQSPITFRNITEKTLWDNYATISSYLKTKEMDEKKLDTFIAYFLERLILVKLDVSNDDVPMLFEVINDRGEKLKSFEILKGKLIGTLAKNETDNYSQQWENAIMRLRDREDIFFIHYFRSRVALIEDATSTDADKLKEDTYHRHILEDNKIANNLRFRKTDNNHKEHIKTFIREDFEYYSNLYQKIYNNESQDEYLGYLQDILWLDGLYPLILAACKRNDEQEAEKNHSIAKEYDRLYMLLWLNGVYDSNEFQEISFQIMKEIGKAELTSYRQIFDNKIIKTIKEHKDSETIDCVLDYYNFSNVAYSKSNKERLRYLLARVEQFICNGLGLAMAGKLYDLSRKRGYHIEHILSHNDTNVSYFTDEQEFETQRNKVGGLLLLKGLDNISSGNEEYTDKLKTYLHGFVWGQTLCADYYHNNNSIKKFNQELKATCGREILPIETFDKDALEQRTALLYEIVKLIWEVS